MPDCATLQTNLVEAEERYHTAIMGKAVAQLGSGHKLVRYTEAEKTDLLKYIQSLRAQIAACTGVPDTGLRSVIRMVPQ